jgi:hypothetical protein
MGHRSLKSEQCRKLSGKDALFCGMGPLANTLRDCTMRCIHPSMKMWKIGLRGRGYTTSY